MAPIEAKFPTNSTHEYTDTLKESGARLAAEGNYTPASQEILWV